MLSLLSDSSQGYPCTSLFPQKRKEIYFFGRMLLSIQCFFFLLLSVLLLVSEKEKLPQWRMSVVLGSVLVPKKMKETD